MTKRGIRRAILTSAAAVASGLMLTGEAMAQARRTITVGPAATPVASGNRLRSTLAGITRAAADRPYLLKIEPGIYDLRTFCLAMKPFVDVEGSGEGVTRILSSVDGVGTVIGAANSALRHLTVENTGPDGAVALRNDASVAIGFGSAATRTDVGASRLEGPVDPGAGKINCVVSYNQALVPLGPTCLPTP